MTNRPRISASRVLLLALLAPTALLAACQSGLTIRNTSGEPLTLQQSVPGGEKSYTLNPGSTLTLPGRSVVNLGGFTIKAE
ncbi:MAG: hypothetical protein ACT4PL_04840 [Phycisphaerales bacterium]